VVDVPAAPGREALFRLRVMGYRLCPVAQTCDGRLWILVQVGAALLHGHTHGPQWRYGTYDVQCHSEGSYVVLPPSPGLRWLAVPDPSRRALPEAHTIIGTIAQACGQSSGLTRRPATPGIVEVTSQT